MKVEVQALDADFFVFSGHKVFGPTGIGAVYGKQALLDAMPPWQGGGNMISDVTLERTVFQPAPHRFEAGTGNIADAVGLGAAIDYVGRAGIENIARYEHELLDYATALMKPIPGVRLIGTAQDKASVLSFVLNGYTRRSGACPQRRGHCRAGRSPLRTTYLAAFWPGGDRAAVGRVLQPARGSRPDDRSGETTGQAPSGERVLAARNLSVFCWLRTAPLAS